ncbi:MAG TPA: insulinase family protein, partial [Candidatus Sumerlaeota bacterium]|nr:insulinase family protein [Candidatus Sumerlaeota bacterium]
MVDVRALGALLAALLLCSCAVTSTHKPTTRSPKTMQTLKLPNGLTVTMQKDPSVPLVTLDMWVRAGGGDEKPELAGVSHFLEHMLFKGTERLAVGEYDHRIESIGGYLNAA